MTSTKRPGNKKTITAILLASLLLVIGIGGTLAYLSATSSTLTNTFTFTSGDAIALTLEEPTWDAEKAKNLTPGSVIDKDPTAKNTGSMDAYLAMKVVFKNGSGAELSPEDYTHLMTMIDIDYDTAKFALDGADGPNKIYVYSPDACATGTKLAPQGTATLFTKVTIHDNISEEDWTWLTGTLNGFNIDVQAAALQADDNVVWDGASGEVKSELVGLFTAGAGA